ncbi:hypothetical protein GW17_00040641, partial [Ensete ventricosum]
TPPSRRTRDVKAGGVRVGGRRGDEGRPGAEEGDGGVNSGGCGEVDRGGQLRRLKGGPLLRRGSCATVNRSQEVTYLLKPYTSLDQEFTATGHTEKDEFLVLASDGAMGCHIERDCHGGVANSAAGGVGQASHFSRQLRQHQRGGGWW